MVNKRKALIVGATGLVGLGCLQRLLESPLYEQVIAYGRSNVQLEHPKLTQIKGGIGDSSTALEGIYVNDVFCCTGTTIKKAKSKAAFKKVDLEYPVIVARLMRSQGAEHFSVVSALGANPESSVFYNHVKGLMEKELESLDYPYLTVMRPSLLVGDRKEFRFGEVMSAKLGKLIRPLMIGPLNEVRPVNASQVSKAMVDEAEKVGHGDRLPGNRIITSRQIQAC